MFLPVFVCSSVCLSVCLSARLLKSRAWIWMKCCTSTDVRTWTNWLTFEPDPDYSSDPGTGLLSPISYKRWYAGFYVGRIPRIRIGAARRWFKMVLFTQPSKHLCRRYIRCTECHSSFTRFSFLTSSSVTCVILTHDRWNKIAWLIDWFSAGIWVGTPLQPAALPVGTRARRTSSGAAAHRDAGENLVPESTLQNEAEAGVGCRAAAPAAASVGGGGDGERMSSSRRQSAPSERRRTTAVRTTSSWTAGVVEPSCCRRRRRSGRRRPTALATRLPTDCRRRQIQLCLPARIISYVSPNSPRICRSRRPSLRRMHCITVLFSLTIKVYYRTQVN